MTATRWLDESEQRAWLGLIAATTLLDAALDRQLQRDAGISHAHYAILAQLSMSERGTMHMSELASLTASSNSRLSHAVSRLESDGLVERTRCPANGRAVHATLTAEGRRLIRRAAPAHVREVRRLLFDRLDRNQVEGLIMFTAELLDQLEQEGYAVPFRS